MAIRRFPWLLFVALTLLGCGAGPVRAPTDATAEAARRDAAVLFRLGKEVAEQGDTVRAEQYLSMALDRGFDERKVLPIMLRVCLSSSRLRAALNHAEPYLREHPNDQNLRYLVASIHLGLGQVDDARIELNHLLRLDPKNANAYYLLGVLESGANVQQAPGHFRSYLDLAPQGEHAVEVKSRLTDLSVRIDLNQSLALQARANLVPRVEPASESLLLSGRPQTETIARPGSGAETMGKGPSKDGAP